MINKPHWLISLKGKISQILKWLEKKKSSLSLEYSLLFASNKNWLSREQNFQILKKFQIF